MQNKKNGMQTGESASNKNSCAKKKSCGQSESGRGFIRAK
jgi:hypothetical protein